MSSIVNRYCLDTNVLIQAWQKYYSPKICPDYWSVLNELGDLGIIFIPQMVNEEIYRTDDDLSQWLKASKITIAKVDTNVTNFLKAIYAADPSHKNLVDNTMKKIMTSLIVTFIAMSSFAQIQSSAHLTFKGVPIDGSLNEYVSKMKQNGFTLIRTEDEVAILNGDFAAYKNCIVGVATLKQKDLVSKIESDTWALLSSNYFSLKDMLTEKYGKPSECVEKFQTGYGIDDDNSKMHEVKMNRFKYFTTYETERGSIQLSIETREMSCYVMLAYYDKINGGIIKAKAIDDL